MSIRKQVLVCMEDLEQQPETSFETDVVSEDEEAFCLSIDNIADIKLLLSRVSFIFYLFIFYALVPITLQHFLFIYFSVTRAQGGERACLFRFSHKDQGAVGETQYSSG